MKERKFYTIVTSIIVVVITVAIITTILMVPRIESVTIFEELAVSTEKIARANIELSETIETLRQEKEEITQKIVSRGTLTTLQELENYVGIREINGNGVIVTISDHPNLRKQFHGDAFPCFGSHVRDVINTLRLPQLETMGISINGERIHLQSSIQCFADGITINTSKIFPPYTIEAIGNSKQMVSTLKTRIFAPDLWNQVDNEIILVNIIEAENLNLPAAKTRPQSSYLSIANNE